MNREEFLAKYDGMEPDAVWRRSRCEMAFIRQEGRESELPPVAVFSDVHDLATRILDEQIEREVAQMEEWNSR